MRAQVLNLLLHIFLDGFIQVLRIQRSLAINTMALPHDFHGRAAVAQPFLDVGQAFQGRNIQCALDGTAISVATDNNMAHTQYRYRVLDGGRHAPGFIAVGRNDVAGVPADKQVSGVGASEHVRVDA